MEESENVAEQGMKWQIFDRTV